MQLDPTSVSRDASSAASLPAGWQGARLVYWAFAALFCGVIALCYCRDVGMYPHVSPAVSAMIDGTASRPFVLRRLVPICVVIVTPVVEAALRVFGHGTEAGMVVAGLLVAVAYHCALFASFHRLSSALFRGDKALVLVSPFLIMMGLTAFYLNAKIYDIGTVLCSSLALLCLRKPCKAACNDDDGQHFHRPLSTRDGFWPYMLVLLAASVNRETSFILIIFWLASIQGLGSSVRTVNFWARVGLQAVCYLVVRAIFLVQYQNHPGEVLAFQWPVHAWAFSAFPLESAVLGGGTVMVLWWALRNRHQKDALMIRSMAAFPLVLAMYFVCGFPFEIRTFLEVYPSISLLLIQNAYISRRALSENRGH